MLKNKVLEWLNTTKGVQFCASVLSARKDKADIDATLAGRPPKDSIWPDVIGDPAAPSEYWRRGEPIARGEDGISHPFADAAE